MLAPVPCALESGNGIRMISVNNLRHEFLLTFFALVECWDSTALVRSNAKSHAGPYDRRLSPFCALLHSFLLAHLFMSDAHRQLEDVELESRDVSEQAQEALERAREFLQQQDLPGHLPNFVRWHCDWSRQFSKGFNNINEPDLSTAYFQAFKSVHRLVSRPSCDRGKGGTRQADDQREYFFRQVEGVWEKYKQLPKPTAGAAAAHDTASEINPFMPGARS